MLRRMPIFVLVLSALWVQVGQAAGLHTAARKGDKDKILKLLESPAYAQNMSLKDEEGKTPLHLAAENGEADIASILIAYEVEVNPRDNQGNTPLHLSTREGYGGVVILLLHKGATPNIKNDAGETPEDVAKGEKASKIIKQIKKYTTLLHAAVASGDENKFHEYLNSPTYSVNERDENGKTPLHIAAQKNRANMASVLIAQEAKLDLRDDQGNTPLHLATREGYEAIVEMLIENGAEVNIMNEEDETPIHIAVRKGQKVIFSSLLQNGAYVNVKNNDGNTPLHIAAENKRVHMVRELIKQDGINLDARNDAGDTPLHRAARKGSMGVALWLLQEGAQHDIKNDVGERPQDVANNERISKAIARSRETYIT